MIRNDIIVDWSLSPRLIIIPTPSTEITIQDLADTCRELEAETGALSEPHLLSVTGKDDLGGGTQVGLTAALNNAVILFEPRTIPLASGMISVNNADGTILIDSLGSFLTDGLYSGCTILNKTTYAITNLTRINSDSQVAHLPLLGGTRQTWSIGDEYDIFPNAQCNISGGNLVALDTNGIPMSPVMPSTNVQVVKTSSASATLQQLTEIQQSMFQNQVVIDPVNGADGIVYPLGTLQYPVKTLVNAKEIMLQRGLRTLYVIGTLTVGASESISNLNINGDGVENSFIVLTSGCTTAKTTFDNLTVSGRQNGETHYHDCEIGNLTNVHCEFIRCRLIGPMAMHKTYNDTSVFFQCYTGDVAGAPFLVDLNDSPCHMSFNDFNGKIQFSNMNKSTAGVVTLNVGAGNIIIDNTCTTGTIKIRGNAEVVDNSAGTIVDNDVTTSLIKVALQPQLDRIDALPTSSEMAVLIQNNSVGVNGGMTLQQATMLLEMYKLMGLDPTKPLVVSQTSRTVDTDIVQQININETTKTTTVTRIP